MNRSAETAVREQAAQLATAWSGAGAPSSWSLTAALFATLRDDPDLLALAARIDPDRLPALLFRRDGAPGASTARAARAGPAADGEGAAPAAAGLRRRAAGVLPRGAHLLPAVAAVVGDDAAPVTLHTTLRGPRTPALPDAPPLVAMRIGVDTEPLDVRDPEVRAWLRACTPPVTEALSRFDRAADHAATHPRPRAPRWGVARVAGLSRQPARSAAAPTIVSTSMPAYR
jgi:hypothetical protein